MVIDALGIVANCSASTQGGEYPRPQLMRTGWCGLDRRVGFSFDDNQVGLDEHWERDPARFGRSIQLPFAPESQASGIGESGFHPCVWYRIVVNAADLRCAGYRQGRRLLLHFGAVDYEATVFFDGQRVGEHIGGQTAFQFDITAAIAPNADEHVITVCVIDDPLDLRKPRGKQDWQETPHAIWYERVTGIWRTVWLESVPELYITLLTWRSEFVSGQVRALVELNRRPAQPVNVQLAISYQGSPMAQASVRLSDRRGEIVVRLDGLDNGVNCENLLWSPDNPRLLDAGLVLSTGENADCVASYLGLRSVEANADRVLLNHRPMIVRAVLEQGYWPDSGYTAPSVEALRAEVQLIVSLGFNCARIHQKVEDERFVYWADRLGLMLWGETAAAYSFDARAVALLTTEWLEIVRSYASHPSIITWVPFNESWGITQLSLDPAQQAYTRGLSDLTRAIDPTRLVISNDGWEHTDSDLLTVHDYEYRREVLEQRYDASPDALLSATVGPAGRQLRVGEHGRTHLPVLVTEFGGVGYVTTSDADQAWGYSQAATAADFEQRLRDILEPIQASPWLAGYCWTQLTDTRQEVNGLCDEHRHPKLPLETLRRLLTGPGSEMPGA